MRFIVTKELGRLAKWLRIMGFDAAYFTGEEKRELVIRSLREERVILTRDSRMARYSGIRMVHISTDFVDEQVRQVIRELGGRPDEGKLFSRCVICNEPLTPIDKEAVREKVAPYVYETQEQFMRCPACDRIYWQGTHWSSVKKLLEKL